MRTILLAVLIGLTLLMNGGAPSPFWGDTRIPASAQSSDIQKSFERLYSASAGLKKEFDYRTFDVSSFEEADENGELKKRSPHEEVVLAIRSELNEYRARVKKLVKRAPLVSEDELKSFFYLSTQRLLVWSTNPLFLQLPSPLLAKLAAVKEALLALSAQYQDQYLSMAEFNGLEQAFRRSQISLKFRSANHACAMVAGPGNFILRKALLIDGNTDNDFSPRIMRAINLLESLKGGKSVLNYRHSEVISKIEGRNNIETVSYYPWYFMVGKPEDERKPMFVTMNNANPEYFTYRSKYAAFRVKDRRVDLELARRESALRRLKKKFFFNRLGTCADFVSWAFSNSITSAWNHIPLVRHLVATLYPPEAIQTPDNLADSPDVEKICEIDNSELVFPSKVDVQDWVNRTITDRDSGDEKIKTHAEEVLLFLVANGVMTEKGELLATEAEFTVGQ